MKKLISPFEFNNRVKLIVGILVFAPSVYFVPTFHSFLDVVKIICIEAVVFLCSVFLIEYIYVCGLKKGLTIRHADMSEVLEYSKFFKKKNLWKLEEEQIVNGVLYQYLFSSFPNGELKIIVGGFLKSEIPKEYVPGKIYRLFIENKRKEKVLTAEIVG